jgi:glutaredoxin-related protein
MITFYGVTGCPDCEYVKTQVQGNPDFKYVNVGENIGNFKAFLKLRDNDPAFDEAKAAGRAGVPCFVREDGSITLNKEDVGIAERPQAAPLAGQACSLDGSGC